MSDKQSDSNSSKKSNSEREDKKREKFKKLKMPKISKLGKVGIKKKAKDYAIKQRVKAGALKSRLKQKFYDKIVHQEVYIDGKEPKSYSFEKKFWGLYGIFVFYLD